MSNKWKLNAKTDFIAHLTMCLFIGKDIPIAIYTPNEKSIQPRSILDDKPGTLTEKQKLELKQAIATIKKI